MSDLTYRTEAAAEYDRAFSHVSAHFLPTLLRAARVAPGQRVLDVATGTGIAAAAALATVGTDGFVLATDASPEMVEKARQRLSFAANAAVAVDDAQSLSLEDGGFAAVLCSLGLMFFPDPARAVGEFHRMLRSGGWAAVSVLTTPERSYNGRINHLLAQHVPAVAQATARTFALGQPDLLRSLFMRAGFVGVEVETVAHAFVLPSFDTYYGPFERGGGSTGQVLVSLPEDTRRAVRAEMRRALGDTAGPVTIEVEFMVAAGERARA